MVEPVAATDPPIPELSAATPKVEGLKAAVELAKQIITLSVGMVALTITFLKDVVAPEASQTREVPVLMTAAWGAYVLATLAALLTLMAISGTLTALDRLAMKLPPLPHHRGAYDIYGGNIRFWMSVMCLAFFGAVSLTVCAAAFA